MFLLSEIFDCFEFNKNPQTYIKAVVHEFTYQFAKHLFETSEYLSKLNLFVLYNSKCLRTLKRSVLKCLRSPRQLAPIDRMTRPLGPLRSLVPLLRF